jgi:glutathione peroxidase-family protein
MDSKLYGEDVYGVTFPFSEMIVSNPAEIPLEAPWLGQGPGLNGNGQPFGERHELYLEISKQIEALAADKVANGIVEKTDYESRYLNQHDGGFMMNANFEKYLIDKDGYVVKHYPATTLNWDVERTLKEDLAAQGIDAKMGPDRSEYIFNEENAVIRDHIERLMAGERSRINPNLVLSN